LSLSIRQKNRPISSGIFARANNIRPLVGRFIYSDRARLKVNVVQLFEFPTVEQAK
jgi:hypothetical protein